MATQTLIWTALPNGYSKNDHRLRVSVFLSPRLDPEVQDRNLSSFQDFVNWPATLAKSTFIISINGISSPAISGDPQNNVGLNCIDTQLGVPDSKIWNALFPLPKEVPVNKFNYTNMSNYRILSYDTRALSHLVLNLYKKIAETSNTELPRISAISEQPEWKNLIDTVEKIDERFVNPEKLNQNQISTEKLKNQSDGKTYIDKTIVR